MGGFPPSSPDYRPLAPLNLPQVQIPPAISPIAEVPPQAVRPSTPQPPPPFAGSQTLPDGIPTPGRIPAYPAYPMQAAYQEGRGLMPGRPSTPLVPQAPPPYPPYGPPGMGRPDNSAIAIEALCAFFGIYGIGWLMAGRTTTGILLVLAGLAWDTIGLGLILTGVGACCFLPLHAVFITLSTVLLSNYIRSMP